MGSEAWVWRALFAAGLVAMVACRPAYAGREGSGHIASYHAPAASSWLGHGVRWPQLQALAGARLRDARARRLLAPSLERVLGVRYEAFRASMVDEKLLRLEGGGLVGEGVTPNTLGYRGAFFVFGRRGEVFAAIKGGPHGTVVERFGSLEVLKEPALLHAYQEFAGIDE